MRRLFIAALGVTLFGSLFALPPATSADGPNQPRSAIASTPDGAAAADLLRRVMRAYVAAPALHDSLTLTVAGQESRATIAFDELGNAAIDIPGVQATVLDDRMYIVMDGIEDRYLDVPLDTDLQATWAQNFGPRSHAPFHFSLRSGELDTHRFLSSLSMGLVRQPQLTGVRNARDEEGNLLLELIVRGVNGEIIVQVDPETMLLRAIRLLAEAPPGMDTPLISAQVRMEPVVSDRLDKPITFDGSGRTAVATPRELQASHSR